MAKRELKATIGLAAIALALGSCGLSAGDAIDGPYARLGPPEMWAERAALVRRSGVEAVADAVIARWFTPAFRDSPQAHSIIDALRAVPPEGYAACCEAVGDFDFEAELQRVRPPTLVLFGEQDPWRRSRRSQPASRMRAPWESPAPHTSRTSSSRRRSRPRCSPISKKG